MKKASLIVLELWLHSTGSGHRFDNVQVTFSLDNETGPTSSPANPILAQWAPFKNKITVNRTVEKQTLTSNYGGELGVSYTAELKGTYNREKEVQREVEYFEEWHSTQTIHPATGKPNGIQLSGIANQSQGNGAGLFGTVRLAVLIQREAAVPYIGRFQVRTRAGFWENLTSTARRWLGTDPRTTILKLSGDDEYVHADDTDVGDAIKAKVDRKRLIDFKVENRLSELLGKRRELNAA